MRPPPIAGERAQVVSGLRCFARRGEDGAVVLLAGVASFHVGTREYASGKAFIEDLAGRLVNRVQLTTDGHKAYLSAVEDAFPAVYSRVPTWKLAISLVSGSMAVQVHTSP